MPRVGRNAAVALLVCLVAAAAFLAPSAMAQEPDEEQVEEDAVRRLFTVRALDENCPEGVAPCWDITILPVHPGDQVTVVVDLTPSAQPHNFHVLEPISEQTPTETGTVQQLNFTIPEDATDRIEFVCDVHPTTMVGYLMPPQAMARLGTEEGVEVPQMGVHFLAYWVGLIAFAILFLIYGITFFLFKYNETSATTDHWDRTGAGEPTKGKRWAANSLLLALLVAAVVGASIIILTQRGSIADLSGQVSDLSVRLAEASRELATLREANGG